jgi:hypothetical protein
LRSTPGNGLPIVARSIAELLLPHTTFIWWLEIKKVWKSQLNGIRKNSNNNNNNNKKKKQKKKMMMKKNSGGENEETKNNRTSVLP